MVPLLPLLLLLHPLLTTAQLPLLAYSHPHSFLGLSSGFHTASGTIAFIPGFHSCGTLLLLSAPSLSYEDFARMSTAEGSVRAGYEGAGEGRVMERDALESEVLAWARGWRRSCGRGEGMREVRVAKVVADLKGEGEARQPGVDRLDRLVSTHIATLPAQPHPHLVLLTTLSPAALTTLFDIVSSQPKVNEGSHGSTVEGTENGVHWRIETGERTHRWKLVHFVWTSFRMVFWLGMLGGMIWVAGVWAHRRWGRKDRGVMLPLTWNEELDLDAE